MEYVQRVSQVRDFARSYWFDVLVAALAIVAILEVVLGFGSPGAPQTTLWFSVPAIAVLALAVFARRLFPFAGPAVYWLLGAGISVVDPLLIPYANALFPIGMADAFLLGNLRDVRRAALGLAAVVGGAITIVYTIPGHAASELVFVPLEFAISWVAGFAVRERAVQAEAAESRATQAERERDTVARIAVAEERTRIARELHDIVAHAVSVMVLQVGAVRHRLPAALAEDREALMGVGFIIGARAAGRMVRWIGARALTWSGLLATGVLAVGYALQRSFSAGLVMLGGRPSKPERGNGSMTASGSGCGMAVRLVSCGSVNRGREMIAHRYGAWVLVRRGRRGLAGDVDRAHCLSAVQAANLSVGAACVLHPGCGGGRLGAEADHEPGGVAGAGAGAEVLPEDGAVLLAGGDPRGRRRPRAALPGPRFGDRAGSRRGADGQVAP